MKMKVHRDRFKYTGLPMHNPPKIVFLLISKPHLLQLLTFPFSFSNADRPSSFIPYLNIFDSSIKH